MGRARVCMGKTRTETGMDGGQEIPNRRRANFLYSSLQIPAYLWYLHCRGQRCSIAEIFFAGRDGIVLII